MKLQMIGGEKISQDYEGNYVKVKNIETAKLKANYPFVKY